MENVKEPKCQRWKTNSQTQERCNHHRLYTMKTIMLITSILLPVMLQAQRQLDIQGNPSSYDTVATIKVNYSGFTDVVGLAIRSEPSPGFGSAGYFYGGSVGIWSKSYSGSGVRGLSTSGFGVYGKSSSDAGVYGISDSHIGVWGNSTSSLAVYGTSSFGIGGQFYGGGGTAIELVGSDSPWGQGGDDCVIRADALDGGSDLILVANDVISFHMDADSNSTSKMLIYNGTNTEILNLDESGNHTITGSYYPSSDINRKEKIAPVDPVDILDKVAALPISEWQFKGEEARHVGPMAQDFYAAFDLGNSETTIATVDADGVALAAIQALKEENDDLKQRIDRLEARLACLEAQ